MVLAKILYQVMIQHSSGVPPSPLLAAIIRWLAPCTLGNTDRCRLEYRGQSSSFQYTQLPAPPAVRHADFGLCRFLSVDFCALSYGLLPCSCPILLYPSSDISSAAPGKSKCPKKVNLPPSDMFLFHTTYFSRAAQFLVLSCHFL